MDKLVTLLAQMAFPFRLDGLIQWAYS
jgi:hypothetical protein